MRRAPASAPSAPSPPGAVAMPVRRGNTLLADRAAVFDWRYNHITLPHHGYGMGPRVTQHAAAVDGHDRTLGNEKAQPGLSGPHSAQESLAYPTQPGPTAHQGSSGARHDPTAPLA